MRKQSSPIEPASALPGAECGANRMRGQAWRAPSRPDGYVGFASEERSAAALLDYLAQFARSAS
jgi:hypothetical protein